MGPKKGRRVRKIEVPMGNVPEFELGDTAADIQQKRQEMEVREREEAQQQREEEASWRQEWRKHTGKRRELQKKGTKQIKMTLKQRLLEERSDHHSHDTRRGT